MQVLAMPSSINFQELSLQLFNLVCHCCQIMQLSQAPQLRWKGKDNPVTELDYLIQYFIINRIKERYGDKTFAIIAQEDLSFGKCPQLKANIEAKYSQLSKLYKKNKVESIPQLQKLTKEFSIDDLCFWIDPLDCTQGFINNRKHETTILMGVSCKGVPICGIIGHPYQKQKVQGKSLYEPKVYFGFTEFQQKCAYQYDILTNTWNTIESKPLAKEVRNTVAVGYRRMSLRQEKMINRLHLECFRMGGAGYKCLQVIKQQVGSLFFIDAKTSKWDSCAGEAIIKAMGGYTIKPNLSQINYILDESYQNKEGFIFTLQSQTYNKILQNALDL